MTPSKPREWWASEPKTWSRYNRGLLKPDSIVPPKINHPWLRGPMFKVVELKAYTTLMAEAEALREALEKMYGHAAMYLPPEDEWTADDTPLVPMVQDAQSALARFDKFKERNVL